MKGLISRVVVLAAVVSVITFQGLKFGPHAGASSSISTVSVTGFPEGAESGAFQLTNFNFALSRSGDLSSPCTVFYQTADGTAFAPEDFNPATGSFTFAAGQAAGQVPVQVIGEYFLEGDETFRLLLTGSSAGCNIGTAASTAFIMNDESPPPPGFFFGGVEGDLVGTDPNGPPDAAVRVNDLVKLRRVVLGLDTLPAFVYQKGDLNGDCGDGRIDSADVALLRQWLLTGGGQRPNCGPAGPTN